MMLRVYKESPILRRLSTMRRDARVATLLGTGVTLPRLRFESYYPPGRKTGDDGGTKGRPFA
jgi:hypothetical protein